MLLTILSFLLQATPHVNPGATPIPDTVTDPVPMWLWIALPFLFIILGIGVYKFITHKKVSPGAGYINRNG